MVQAWADAQTVLDITGVEVTEPQLAQAQAAVEVMCGRAYPDTSRLRVRDVYWLARAVAYQAAWSQGQFDLATRMDVTAAQQDSVSSSFTGDAVVLAPMAARAINRLSWRRSRTIHVRSPFVDGSGYGADPLSEAADKEQDWQPLEGAR